MMSLLPFILLAILSGLVIAVPFIVHSRSLHRQAAAEPSASKQASMNLAIHRQRLAELDDDLSNGVISSEAYAEAKAELEADAARDLANASAADANTAQWQNSRLLGPVLLLLMVVLALVIYWWQGAYPVEQALQDQAELASDSEATLEDVKAATYQFLQSVNVYLDPNDEKAFGDYIRLAMRYAELGQSSDAMAAYQRGVALMPEEIEKLEKLAIYLDYFTYSIYHDQAFESENMQSILAKVKQLDSERVAAFYLIYAERLLATGSDFFSEEIQVLFAQAGQYDGALVMGVFFQVVEKALAENNVDLVLATLAQLQVLIEQEQPRFVLSNAMTSDFYFRYASLQGRLTQQPLNPKNRELYIKAAAANPENLVARVRAGHSALMNADAVLAEQHFTWALPRLNDPASEAQVLNDLNQARSQLGLSATTQAIVQAQYRQEQARMAAEEAKQQAKREALLAAAIDNVEFMAEGEEALADPCPMERIMDEGLTVQVSIAPELQSRIPANAILYVYAKAPDETLRQPIGVRRFDQFALPLSVTLTDSDKLGMTPEKISDYRTWRVFAKITASGIANLSAGDLFGGIQVQSTDKKPAIVINQIAE